MYVFQRRLQYFPARQVPPPPEGVEDVTFTASDGVTLRAWYWPGSRDVTLVLFHGNAGHRGDRLEWMTPLHVLGWGLLLVDYRGYGGSEGSPTEQGLYRDGEAAADYLRGRGLAKLVYFGESLGCGVAVETAVRRPPAGLICQAGATSLVAVGKRAYPWLPVGLLMRDRFDSAARVAEARCPVLCIHGTDDTTIPIEMGRALFDAAREPKEWFPIDGGGHNDLSEVGGAAYYERVHEFLEKL
ncbi:MAG: alpha/beta hydrolase [Planctomycetota bacterium]